MILVVGQIISNNNLSPKIWYETSNINRNRNLVSHKIPQTIKWAFQRETISKGGIEIGKSDLLFFETFQEY